MVNELRHNGDISDRLRLKRGCISKLWNFKGIITLGIILTTIPIFTSKLEVAAATVPGIMFSEGISRNTNFLSSKPVSIIGEPVTIIGKPLQKVGAKSFILSDKQQLSGTNAILVVNNLGFPFDLSSNKDTNVQVRGLFVRRLARVRNEDINYGVPPKLYAEYANKPAIIAQSIIPVVQSRKAHQIVPASAPTNQQKTGCSNTR